MSHADELQKLRDELARQNALMESIVQASLHHVVEALAEVLGLDPPDPPTSNAH